MYTRALELFLIHLNSFTDENHQEGFGKQTELDRGGESW